MIINENLFNKEKCFEMIRSIFTNQIGIKSIEYDDPLVDLGVDSMTFIHMVVALEEEYYFEFDDEKLLLSEFPTINSVIDYIENKISTTLK